MRFCDNCGEIIEDDTIICPLCGKAVNDFVDDYIEDDEDSTKDINISRIDNDETRVLTKEEREMLLSANEECYEQQKTALYTRQKRVAVSLVVALMLSFVFMILLFLKEKSLNSNIYYVTNKGDMYSLNGKDSIINSDEYQFIYNDRKSGLASLSVKDNSMTVVTTLNTKNNQLYYDKNSNICIYPYMKLAYRYDYINDCIEFYELYNMKSPYVTVKAPEGFEIAGLHFSSDGKKILVTFEYKNILTKYDAEYTACYVVVDEKKVSDYIECNYGEKLICNNGTVINIKSDKYLEICNANCSYEIGESKCILLDSLKNYVYILKKNGQLYRISCRDNTFGNREKISDNADDIYAEVTSMYTKDKEAREEYCYTVTQGYATARENSKYIYYTENNVMYRYNLESGKKKKMMEFDSKVSKIYNIPNGKCVAITQTDVYDVSEKKTISKYYNTLAVCSVQVQNNGNIYFINGESDLIKYNTNNGKREKLYGNVQLFYVYDSGTEAIFYCGTDKGYYYYDGEKAHYLTQALECSWHNGTFNDTNDADRSNSNMPVITYDSVYYLMTNGALIQYDKESGIKTIIKENVVELFSLPYYN